MDDDEPLLLGVNRVCELTGLGRTTIYAEIRSGRLQTVTVGRRRLIPWASLDEWIRELSEGGSARSV